MLTTEGVAEILLDIDAVSLNLTEPYTYASGIVSPIYTDCRLLFAYPDARKAIIDTCVAHLQEIDEEIDSIVSAGPSAISLATHLTRRLDLPMAYVRSEKKTYGKKKKIEGHLEEGSNVLVVADIMSTEKDIQNSVKAIRNHGADVTYCLTVFSNNLGIVEDFLRKEKIPFHTLTDLPTLLNVASEKGEISPYEREVVEEWMDHPKNWKERRQKQLKQTMKETSRKIADILLEIEAVQLQPDKPFEYSSGMRSPIYTDNRLLTSYPEKWKEVMDGFITLTVNKVGLQNVDVLAGIATSGISHTAYLAEALDLPMVYVKSEAEEHGKRRKIEGRIRKGDSVLIIDDLVTTGSSVLSTAKTLREAGAIVQPCIVIFSYDLKRSKVAFEREDIRLRSLTDLPTLLDVAVKEKYIDERAREIVQTWASDPEGWLG